MSNQCPYCGSLRNVCVNPASFKYVCLSCEKFFNRDEQPKQSVFDRITTSEETLAEKLIHNHYDSDYGLRMYHSTIIKDKWFASYREAFSATVEKLKEVTE